MGEAVGDGTCPHRRERRRQPAWRGAAQGCRWGVDVPWAVSAYRCSEPRGLSQSYPCGRRPHTVRTSCPL